MIPERLSDAALTSKAIKKRLKEAYPDVKFSVTCSNYSMGNSVTINWTDGPMQEDVEKITKQYQCGSFDGMEDLYIYKNIDPSLECPGSKYVFCSRSRSRTFSEQIIAKAFEFYNELNEDNHLYHQKLMDVERMFFPYSGPVVNADISNKKECSILSELEYEVIKDVDTRNNNDIFVVKIKTKVDDFKTLNIEMHKLGGHYSRFKSGFIFKNHPTEKLKGNTVEMESETLASSEKGTELSDTSSIGGLSLLDRLNAVEVTTENRFSPDDMAYCLEQEKIYKEAHRLHSDIMIMADSFVTEHEKKSGISRKYISKYSGSNDSAGMSQYRNSILNDNLLFIDLICSHFRKKYNVSLEAPKWVTEINNYGKNRKEPRMDIVTLDYILDSIYQQMGGLTFEEKALNEITRKMKTCVYNEYNNTWKMTIKGNKLHIDRFYSSCFCRIFKEYEITVKEHNTAFFKALTHFEYNSAYLNQKYDKYTGHYTIYEKTGIYDKHAVPSSVIKNIKIYKNGKVEFEFVDSNKARLFAKKYCGFTEQLTA